jgi:hypothetical protein
MDGLRWIADNWATLLSAVAAVGDLFFMGAGLRAGVKTQRIANLLTITTNHWEIWKEFSSRPELARVLDATANVTKQPINPS